MSFLRHFCLERRMDIVLSHQVFALKLKLCTRSEGAGSARHDPGALK
jgi:hypothetical protein